MRSEKLKGKRIQVVMLSHDVPKNETEPFKSVKARETFTEETSLALTSLNYSVKFFGQP